MLEVTCRDVTMKHIFSPFDITVKDTINPCNIRSEKVIEVFSTGQCHSLAFAISEKTGWPMIGLFGEDDFEMRDNGQDYTPKHVTCKSPLGLVDITGIEAKRWLKKLGGLTPLPVSPEDVLNYEHINYLPIDLTNARLFVPAVLNLIEKQTGRQIKTIESNQLSLAF